MAEADMTGCPQTQQMLSAVRRRLFVAKIANRGFWLTCIFAGAYALLLLLNRLTGLVPNVFAAWTLGIPFGLGLLAALAWPARLTAQDAARSVDQSQKTRDLFLTLTMLESTAGEYQPLVARDAEKAAPKVKPPVVVPFNWERRAAWITGIAATLALGFIFLPTLDPFGKNAEAKEILNQQKKLVESRKATEIRKAQLKQQDVDLANSPDVEKAIEKLKLDLKSMRKDQKNENSQKLNLDQKGLGEKFRATNEALKSLMNQNALEQKLGSQNASEFKKWQEDLQKGSSEGMSKALEELKEELEQLAKTDDPVARTEMERKIEKRLKAMAEFAGEKTGSKALSAALERAKEQMEAVKKGKPLSMDAMQAMQESLDLAKTELKEVAQSSRDMKALEEALETIAMAKQVNQQDQLDGAMTDAATAMEDYKELYAELMAQLGMSEGEGEGEGDGDGDDTGGKGMGNGGKVDEDDGVETGFVSEQTKTPIQKGKILMSMKQKGMSESGEAKREFQQILNEVKQGYAEAIESEQIPPGYRDGIKNYFDSLGKDSSDSEPAPAAKP